MPCRSIVFELFAEIESGSTVWAKQSGKQQQHAEDNLFLPADIETGANREYVSFTPIAFGKCVSRHRFATIGHIHQSNRKKIEHVNKHHFLTGCVCSPV